jgi:hypothetical protein
MSIVHTYYDPVPDIDEGIQQKEIAVWRDSWERWGWECRVLGRADVVITPDELARLQRLPSVNPPGYDMACYLRWFAMRNLGGGLMVDYDVVNVGWTPDDAEWLLPIPRMLASGFVPCAMDLTAGAAVDLCVMLLSYQPDAADLFEGRAHVSDMTIMQRMSTPDIPGRAICQEPQHADERTRLLHLSHNAMHAMGLDDAFHRFEVMRVLAQLGAGRARS